MLGLFRLGLEPNITYIPKILKLLFDVTKLRQITLEI